MAQTNTPFNHLTALLFGDDIDFTDAALPLYLALVTSSYTFDATDTVWADISANEVASGDGYTTGGEAIGSLSYSIASGIAKLDAADVLWSTLTKTFRRGIVYASGTYGALTNPVLCALLYDDTPGDISVAASNFQSQWGANGIFRVGLGTIS